jgi:exosome complex component RRP46
MSAKGGRRKNLELRSISIQKHVLDNHDGSAIFSFGNVRALATISGPSEVRIRDELTDRSTLEIHYTPLQGIPGITALAFSTALVDTFSHVLLLHLHPRSLVQINLQTYASPPTYISQPLLRREQKLRQPRVSPTHPDAPIPVSLQAAHINAISIACLDAAIHMQSIVIASSAVVARKGIRKNFMKGWKAGETLVDEEEIDSGGQSG